MGEQNKEGVRLSGYLEKKGGMKLIPAWKQYWFVLKGQLLLYYRSEADYLNISVHKGSINMGLASNVRPGLNRPNIIEIITRTQIVTLRTKDRSTQEQWLQAMLESMAVPKSARNSTVPMHMRYSLDNLPVVSKDVQTADNNNCATTVGESKDSIIARINRLGGRSYGTGSFESAIHRHSISHRAAQETENGAEVDNRISQDGSYVSEYAYIDNKLYHRSQSDSIHNISSSAAVVKNISEDEDDDDDAYEQLPVDSLKKQAQHEQRHTDSLEREQHTVSTIQGNRPPILEPELPPRSPSKRKQHISDAEEDLEYAECYEEVGLNENKQGNGKEKAKLKKKNSKKVKSKNKELKQEPLNKEKNSKNGKSSFFKSVFGHYRKKAETEKISSGPDQAITDLPEEPAYESVECTPAIPAPAIPADVSETDLSEVSPTKGVCKRSLLPSITLTELQQKLKTYDDHKDGETSNADNKGNNGIPDDEHTEKSSESSPPSLPPRRSIERRPSSPWHDVPTNNSPVDGDSNKLTLSQEQQDSLLGTPEGFALLKSKWQAAERGGEWNPELHHLKLLQSPDEDIKKEDSDSMPSLSHLYSKVDKKSKTSLDKMDSRELNFQPGEQQLIIPVSPSHKIPITRTDVREEQLDGDYGMMDTSREDSKKEEEDNFQQDSLMSCLSSDKEYIISRDSLQDKSLSLELPTDQKNERHIQELNNRNSNDLNILLAQLAEITTAPLLTPGATSSLVNYPHSDMNDKLALMEPIRRRRHSEPDYDIPRPHQPLLIQPPSDAERSPNLDKKHRERHQYEDAISCNLSISPDSLEPVPSH
ncbi:uncharacterized protein LOC124797429 [Schistocerca piceifrons]|uniref:uncharacterized protein LOC124797429 n=1 Tax=Schistocerca piceifrons TaxID=274613 RepID=UPI001F5E4297|nr:uncharacterized protein LOC124797429 [Schistocerca piceifrons]XP_047116741.1 uncharacterized protein LOC124797429 [Schistocerca piceifrons]XP_047116743.1 uncharacterized protein LOC124797429 [Schistocerca piceifrons]